MEEGNFVLNDSDKSLLRRFAEFKNTLWARLEQEIVGQRRVVEEILVAFFVGEHVFLTGVTGLGKTQIARSLAEALSLKFSRIEFTADLLPCDVLELSSANALKTGKQTLDPNNGSTLSNILLASELNRAAPKIQSLLLDLVRERKATLGSGKIVPPAPFLVIATQNPVENEETLDRAQLDLFLFSSKIDYLRLSEEIEMTLRTTDLACSLPPLMVSYEDIHEFQGLIRRIPAPRSVVEYAVKIVRKTRPQTKTSSSLTQKYVEWGASPRASQALILSGKAFAAFDGRETVSFEDVERSALPALRSRVILNKLAQADGITPDFLINKILLETRSEMKGE